MPGSTSSCDIVQAGAVVASPDDLEDKADLDDVSGIFF
jgi:hypothetical protein